MDSKNLEKIVENENEKTLGEITKSVKPKRQQTEAQKENVKKMMEKSLNKQWEQFLAEQEKEEKQKPFRTPVVYLDENDLVIPEGNYLVKDESKKKKKKERAMERTRKFIEEQPKKDEGIKKYFKSQKK